LLIHAPGAPLTLSTTPLTLSTTDRHYRSLMHHCSLVHQGPLFLHSTAYGRHLSLRHHRSLTHHCSLVQSGPLLHSLLLTGITAHSCTGAPLTLSTTDRHHCSLLNFPSEESACILHWSSRSRLHLCLILGSLPCPFFGQCPDRA